MNIASKFFALALLAQTSLSFAVTAVLPNISNINQQSGGSVMLNYSGLSANEETREAFWCGDVSSTGISSTNPCIPGTLLGRSLQNHSWSYTKQNGVRCNFIEVMNVPPSVTRKAFQQALQGADPDFFYIRRFSDAGQNSYISVRLKLSSSSINTPLSLNQVKIQFQGKAANNVITFITRGEKLPEFGAQIRYSGQGRLKGRWELVLPGDIQPRPFDLYPAASVPVEQRILQRRYTLLGRFNKQLPSSGTFYLPGPKNNPILSNLNGAYKILLRLESELNPLENNAQIELKGALSGFPLPVLRYYVGSQRAMQNAQQNQEIGQLTLLSPDDESFKKGDAITFKWLAFSGSALYQLEVRNADNQLALSAAIKADDHHYAAPPWLIENSNTALRWRITALDKSGQVNANSAWRTLNINPKQTQQ